MRLRYSSHAPSAGDHQSEDDVNPPGHPLVAGVVGIVVYGLSASSSTGATSRSGPGTVGRLVGLVG